MLIEDEPSLAVQAQMKRAVSNYILEALLLEGAVPLSVSSSLAELKRDQVKFSDSRREPKLEEESVRSLFRDLLTDIEFTEPRSSRTLHGLKPTIKYQDPVEIGQPQQFRHLYMSYAPDWSKTMKEQGGQLFRTDVLLSAERVPIIVIKVYANTPTGKQFLGAAALDTHDLLDVSKPFNRVWIPIKTPFIYTISHENEDYEHVPVREFFSLWQVVSAFRGTGVTEVMVTEAVRESLASQGATVQLQDARFISVKPGSVFSGEMLFETFFATQRINRGLLGAPTSTLEDTRQLEFESRRQVHDMHGLALRNPVYNPNLTGFLEMRAPISDADETHLDANPMELWQFEEWSYENQQRMEAYTRYLSQQHLPQWRRFFTGTTFEGGPEQWKEIQRSLDCQMLDPEVNGNWSNTVNEQYGNQLPRFLLEVWSDDEFHGEYLLPRVMDIKQQLQTVKLFKLESSSRAALTRFDKLKSLGDRRLQGWIYVHATWRLLNPRTGRLNLQLREVRDTDISNGRPPQVHVWMHDERHGTWSRVMLFTPFEFGVNFLKAKQAKRSMSEHWVWDSTIMGQSEPDWRNFYSWDEPGQMLTEEREVHVPLAAHYAVKHQLPLGKAGQEVSGNVNADIWRLLKGGVPSVLRQYLWTEVSGAIIYQKQVNKTFEETTTVDERLGCTTAYQFLCRQCEVFSMDVFDMIKRDLDDLQTFTGMDHTHYRDVQEVVQALVCFGAINSVPQMQGKDNKPVIARVVTNLFVGHKTGAMVGQPIAYSAALTRLVFYLMADFQGDRLSNENVFYLVFAVCCSIGCKKSGVPQAPFLKYFTLKTSKLSDEERQRMKEDGVPAPKASFADDIPYVLRDALLVRAALECFYPEQAETLQLAGVHPEELLYGPLQSLFAGYLPSQSLYRLWDMLFNSVYPIRAVVEADLSFGDVESFKPSSAARGICQTPLKDIQQGLASGTRTTDTSLRSAQTCFFDESSSRRVVVCLAFGLLLRTLKTLPETATARELRDAFTLHLQLLRDPSELVRIIDCADFVLFTSNYRINHLLSLYTTYLQAKRGQLSVQKEQNSLLHKLLQNSRDQHGLLVSSHVAAQFNRSAIYMEDKYKGLNLKPGLHTSDLADHVMPLLKYHTLFAPPHERWLPEDGLGRIVFKVDMVELMAGPLHKHLVIEVVLGKDKQQIKCCRLNDRSVYTFEGDSAFWFLLHSEPPYLFKFRILDESGRMKLCDSKKGLQLPHLKTHAETWKAVKPCHFESTIGDVRLWFSYFMMKGPDATHLAAQANDSSMVLGGGCWGDITGFYPMYANVDYRSHARKYEDFVSRNQPLDSNIRGAAIRQTERPAAYGLEYGAFTELLFHSIPSLLPKSHEIFEKFCGGTEGTIAVRDLVGSLVLISNGSVQEKAALLFDVFGHHEEEIHKAAQGAKNHNLYYDVSPWQVSDNTLALAEVESVPVPRGALMCIRNATWTETNRISVAECAGILHAICNRSLQHVDMFSAYQMACSTFDPEGLVPGINAAYLVCQEGLDKEDVKVIQGDTSRRSTRRRNREIVQNLSIDVTSELLRWVQRECGEYGTFGLNFTHVESLEDLGIHDVFSGYRKTLKVCVNDGNYDTPTVITLEIGVDSRVVSGTGGNFRRVASGSQPGFEKQSGRFGTRNPAVELGHPLADASHLFEVHRITLDKQLFMTRFLASDFLSEPLRRFNSVHRFVQKKNLLDIDSQVALTVDDDLFLRAKPIDWSAKQPESKCCRKATSMSGSDDGDNSQDNENEAAPDVSPNEMSPQDTTRTTNAPLQMGTPDDLSDVKKVSFVIQKVKDLFDPSMCSRIDPYVRITVGKKTLSTRTRKYGEGFADYQDQALEFNYKHNKTAPAQIEVVEDDGEKQTVIGRRTFDIEEVLNRKEMRVKSQDYSLSDSSNEASRVTMKVHFSCRKGTTPPTPHSPLSPKRKSLNRCSVRVRSVNSVTDEDQKLRKARVVITHGDAKAETSVLEDPDSLDFLGQELSFTVHPDARGHVQVHLYEDDDVVATGDFDLSEKQFATTSAVHLDLWMRRPNRPAGKVALEVKNTFVGLVKAGVVKPELVNDFCVQVISGHNLTLDHGKKEKIDPYVVVRYGKEEHKTEALNDAGSNPVWDETLRFDHRGNVESLELEVYDKDRFSKDDFLGSVVLPLSSLYERGWNSEDQYVVLDAEGNSVGQLRLGFDFSSSETLSPAGRELPSYLRIRVDEWSLKGGKSSLVPYIVYDSDEIPIKVFLDVKMIPFKGRDSLLLELRDGHKTVAAAPISMTKHLEEWLAQESPVQTTVDLHNDEGKDVGSIKYELSFQDRPSDPPNSLFVEVVSTQNSTGIRYPYYMAEVLLFGSADFKTPSKKLSTSLKLTDDPLVVPYHESFVVDYANEQFLNVKFYGVDNDRKSRHHLWDTNYDLWMCLKNGDGCYDVPIPCSSPGKEGCVAVNRFFFCPRNLKSLPENTYYRVIVNKIIDQTPPKDGGPERFGVSVHTMYSDQKHEMVRNKGGKTPMNHSYTFKYMKEPSVWLSLLAPEHYDPGANEFLSRASLDIWDMVRNGQKQFSGDLPLHDSHGSPCGKINVDFEFVHVPQVMPEYLKVNVGHGRSLYDDEAIGPRDPWVNVFLCPGKLKETCSVKNTGRSLCKWNEGFVFHYDGEPTIELNVMDSAHQGSDYLGKAVVSLWDVLEGRAPHDHVVLFKDGKAAGKLSATFDFYHKPEHVAPTAVQVVIKNAADLAVGQSGSPFVAAGCGVNVRNYRRTNCVKGGGKFARFNKELLMCPWDQSSEYLWVSVYDQQKGNSSREAKLVGSAKLHVWDLLRDPNVPWVGKVRLSQNNHQAGYLNVAIQLVAPVNLEVPFRSGFATNGADAQCGHSFAVSLDDTAAVYKEKVALACADVGRHRPNDPNASFYKYCGDLPRTHEVVFRTETGNEIVLDDHARLGSYKEIATLHGSGVAIPLQLRSRCTTPRTHGRADSSLALMPRQATTYPGPACKARKREQLAYLYSPPSCLTLGNSYVERVGSLEFLMHPNSRAPLRNLGWCKQLMSKMPKAGETHYMNRVRIRKNYWMPATILRGTYSGYEMQPLCHNETLLGFDEPERVASLTAPFDNVLLNFRCSREPGPYNPSAPCRGSPYRAADPLRICPQEGLVIPDRRKKRRAYEKSSDGSISSLSSLTGYSDFVKLREEHRNARTPHGDHDHDHGRRHGEPGYRHGLESSSSCSRCEACGQLKLRQRKLKHLGLASDASLSDTSLEYFLERRHAKERRNQQRVKRQENKANKRLEQDEYERTMHKMNVDSSAVSAVSETYVSVVGGIRGVQSLGTFESYPNQIPPYLHSNSSTSLLPSPTRPMMSPAFNLSSSTLDASTSNTSKKSANILTKMMSGSKTSTSKTSKKSKTAKTSKASKRSSTSKSKSKTSSTSETTSKTSKPVETEL
ncbi:MAG: hypothetical protein KVP17_000913 [Porospora cf. gigantea B]|nr:MAG: hypothetical protein KVP17_000913 [Porospora cf. gigantea B]